MNSRILTQVAIALGLLTLSASLTLNWLLFKRAKFYYLELNEVRLDPAEVGYYPESPPEKQSDRPRVVFFGDSRAESWPAPEQKAYEWLNRGIDGQTSVQVWQRFPEHVIDLQPDVVVVQVGINDLKTIGLFPQRRDEIVANCISHIHQIVTTAEVLGATVILTTIFPVGDIPLERRPFWSGEIEQAIAQVNAEIQTLASDRVIILDAFGLLADEQGKNQRAYQKDELHLTPAGYAQLNPELLAMLAQEKR
ncbi:MAG: SGNH/GDSL hydrolase family protein [Spirulina sp. SIO3F2]|nr:SGNH/GDSL hydrolase family protein [Spirulina sp. SIO3F2]